MAHFFSLMALLWVRPVAILEVLQGDDIPVSVSIPYGFVCGFIGALFPWFSGTWSTSFAIAMMVAATVAPVVFGALLWGASRLFGSETSTSQQSIALAAALLGVFPLASLFQFIAAKAALGLFGGVVLPLMYFMVLLGMSFVVTLQANPLAGAGVGTLGVLAAFGFAIVVWKQQHPIVVPERAESGREAPAPSLPAEVEAAPPPRKQLPVSQPPALPPLPDGPERWEVKLSSVPPGAEVVEVVTGKPLGTTPVSLFFPFSVKKIDVRLKLGSSEATRTLSRDAQSTVVVKLER